MSQEPKRPEVLPQTSSAKNEYTKSANPPKTKK